MDSNDLERERGITILSKVRRARQCSALPARPGMFPCVCSRGCHCACGLDGEGAAWLFLSNARAGEWGVPGAGASRTWRCGLLRARPCRAVRRPRSPLASPAAHPPRPPARSLSPTFVPTAEHRCAVQGHQDQHHRHPGSRRLWRRSGAVSRAGRRTSTTDLGGRRIGPGSGMHSTQARERFAGRGPPSCSPSPRLPACLPSPLLSAACSTWPTACCCWLTAWRAPCPRPALCCARRWS